MANSHIPYRGGESGAHVGDVMSRTSNFFGKMLLDF